MPDLAEYMTVEEFAALPADVHHAAWQAASEHRIDVIPSSRATSATFRYLRSQVLAIIGETAAAR